MRVLLFSDLHLSDKAPSACEDTYLDDLFDLLEQVSEIAESRQVQMVVCAGDYFHNKQANRNSHRLVQRSIEWASSLPCAFYVVPGNHDEAFNRLDSIMESQPLGVLFRSGAATMLSGWMPYTRHPVYGVPWLQEFSEESVGAALADFGGREDGLVVAHAPLYPPGQELPYEYFLTEKWAALQGGGACFYGHIHEPHGVYTVGGVTFANFGALSRGSLHEYNLSRHVSVGIWDSDRPSEFEEVVLDYKPASQVFKLAEKREDEERKARFDEFLESVGYATVEVMSIEAVMESIRAMQLGDDVNALVAELLEEAQHGD